MEDEKLFFIRDEIGKNHDRTGSKTSTWLVVLLPSELSRPTPCHGQFFPIRCIKFTNYRVSHGIIYSVLQCFFDKLEKIKEDK